MGCNLGMCVVCLISLIIIIITITSQITPSLASKSYIVYMGNPTPQPAPPAAAAAADATAFDPLLLLAALHGGSIELAQASHLYTYRRAFRGFAAKLTLHQASQLSRMPGVISVFPNFRRSLHTTHSWDFMGLFPDESMEIPGFSTSNQHNVIIGFIDTGIWPESPSFSDLNLPPVPSTWKGECQEGEAFNASSCNRKVIGARYYLGGFEAEEGSIKTKDFRSPRDSSGHGCHTASIAAGRYVKNMNFNGLGAGGARGGAPLARIVAYKTCWDSGCYDVDILAAFDDAIKDGVDILSISLGPDAPQGDYFKDAISIGSFHAVSHGIVVVSSVGNERTEGSATNVAPWIITVSASSTDRDFRSEIILGGRTTYTGESLTKREINASTRIISASKAFSGYFTPYQSSYCLESSLDNTKASGKVLVCRHAESSFESKLAKSIVVKKAGGVGMILIDEEDQDIAIPFVIPAAIVGTHTGDRILAYVNSSRKPTARILSSKTVLGSRPAPQVASFSSRGPNALTPEILKPDVTAPGLNILAAWSPANGNVHFNILSGTSMACPHATGIVALIKAVHPSWSPSAIKSAIMTTAMVLDKKWKHITVDPTGRRGNPFDFGAGFLNPTRVLNPGLVYDAQPEDYKAFLCSVGYDEKSLHLVTGDNSSCNKQIYRSAADLNYPSISVPNLRDSYSVTRTLTNVGRPRSIYEAFWSSPVGINVTVSPKLLVFKKYGEKVNFTVNFKVTAPSKGYRFGTLTWRRGKLRVSSPLVVRVVSSDSGLLR